MLPENRLNPMGLNSQGAASMVGNISQSGQVPTEEIPQENPAEKKLQEVAKQFASAWKMLEDLNASNGGDVDKFRTAQKSLETWFADLTTKLPESSPQAPTY